MANQLLNSVIEAMIAGHKQQQEKGDAVNRVALEREKLKQDKEYKDQLTRESEEKIEESHRRAIAEEDLRAQGHDLAVSQAKEAALRSRATVGNAITKAINEAPVGIDEKTGRPHADLRAEAVTKLLGGTFTPGRSPSSITPDEMMSGAPQPQGGGSTASFPDIGIQSLPISGMGNPEGELQRQSDLSGAKATGPMELIQQKLIQQHENDLARDSAKADANYQQQLLRGQQTERNTNLRGQYQNASSRIAANGHVLAVGLLNKLGLTGDGAAALAEHGRHQYEGVIRGDIDPTKSKQEDNAAGQLYAQSQGTVMPNDSKHKENIEALDYMQSLINRHREFADKYSNDSKEGGPLARFNDGKSGLVSPSPLNAAYDSLKSEAVKSAATNSGIKRLNMGEVLLGINGDVTPNKSRAENMKVIDADEAKLVPLVRKIFPSGTPDDYITKVLGERGISLGQGGIPEPSQAPPSASGTNPRTIPTAPAKIERHPNNPAYIKNPATGKYRLDPNYVPPATQSPTAVTPQAQGLGAQ